MEDLLPFDPARARFTLLGRCAVWRAARTLGLACGDEVLVPAYNCGSELDPLVVAGVRPVAYRVDRAARIDLDDLKRRVTPRTKAVYATHYFGFAQPLDGVRRFCDEHRLPLIEDCALALFTEDGDPPVGRTGDVVVYSFRKLLPVPDGAAMVMNDPSLGDAAQPSKPVATTVQRRLLPLLARSTRQRLPRTMRLIEWPLRAARSKPGHAGAGRRGAQHDRPGHEDRRALSDDDRFDVRVAEWGMSAVSRRILTHFDRSAVIDARRENYRFYLRSLGDVKTVTPLSPELPDGACPVVFPITTPHRDALCAALMRRGVGAIPWWAGYHPAIDWNDHPDAAWLKDHVLALPVHQHLSGRDLSDIVDAVRVAAARESGEGVRGRDVGGDESGGVRRAVSSPVDSG